MITHKELMENFQKPELNKHEAGVLKNLEKMTDLNIKDRFDGTNTVFIDSKLVDKILDELSGTRRSIVESKWRSMYADGGWDITYSSDRDGGAYIVSPKRK